MAGIDETRTFVPVRIAILTVSDTRTLADDKSGDTLQERVKGAGHILADRAILKDDVEAIRAKVQAWISDANIDCIITTGGTGFTGRDVTPEATRAVIERDAPGIAEALRAFDRDLSTEGTPRADLAVFVSEESNHYVAPKCGGQFRYDGILQQIHELNVAGVPYRLYLQSDLGRAQLPEHKAYLFLNQTALKEVTDMCIGL